MHEALKNGAEDVSPPAAQPGPFMDARRTVRGDSILYWPKPPPVA